MYIQQWVDTLPVWWGGAEGVPDGKGCDQLFSAIEGGGGLPVPVKVIMQLCMCIVTCMCMCEEVVPSGCEGTGRK